MGLFGGGSNVADKQYDLYKEQIEQTYLYNLQTWAYQLGLARDNYAYQWESLDFARYNDAVKIAHANQQSANNWIDQEAMRIFNYENQVDAYNASILSLDQQLDLNHWANELALNDANRAYQEDMIKIGFQNEDLMMKYHQQGKQTELKQKGFTKKVLQAENLSDLQKQEVGLDVKQTIAKSELDKAGLRQGLAATKAEAALKAQGARLENLVEQGKVRSQGQVGRTAEKNLQAVLFDHGTLQSALVDSVTQAESKYMLDRSAVAQVLQDKEAMSNYTYSQISHQLLNTVSDVRTQSDQTDLTFGQLKDTTDFGRRQLQMELISTGEQHEANKQKLKLQKFQADINAESRVQSQPKLPPEASKPLYLPTPVYQNPMFPKPSPVPLKGINTAPQGTQPNQLLTIGAGALAGLSIGSSVGTAATQAGATWGANAGPWGMAIGAILGAIFG